MANWKRARLRIVIINTSLRSTSIKRIVDSYKRLLKENEELKNNKTLVEKILDKGKGFTLQQTQYIWEHYIPVQKIKDIIDRIDYDIKKTKEIISNDAKSNYQITRLKAMNTKSLDIKKRLQELLEEGEHNNGE